ncbi:hypothetical protein P3S68_030347 [Capsicum galapagoense]
MTYSSLAGPLDPVLLNLRFLSVLRLDWNLFSMSTVPEFLANFKKLTTLGLAGCKLRGVFPSIIFQVPNLQKLDLSQNDNLTGTLPEFPHKSALRDLRLHRTTFTGSLPNSIANLQKMTWLSLWGCNFGLSHLEYLNLEENSISGIFPVVILSLLSLQKLLLRNNYFSGDVHEFPNAFSSVLETLDLSNNHLNGSIPRSIFKLKGLLELFLFSNSFSGIINIEVIMGLPRF